MFDEHFPPADGHVFAVADHLVDVVQVHVDDTARRAGYVAWKLKIAHFSCKGISRIVSLLY